MAALTDAAGSAAAAGRLAPGAAGARRPRAGAVVRISAGVAVVVATAVVVGLGPFLHGLTAVSPPAVLAAFGLIAAATAAAAWRWRVVATGFGLDLPWREAFGAYYRSQFLNAVLPGGVVGDVHRAYAHGRAHARVGLAARAVVAERVLGQVVQLALTLVVVLSLGFGTSLAPVAWGAGVVAAAVVAATAVAAIVPRSRRALQREWRMLRPVLARPLAVVAIVVSSVVFVAALVALFVVAGVAVGIHASLLGLVSAGTVVLAASTLPVNVGGWGPREAVAGVAFALAGAGAASGVAVSTAFGVLALIAVAPGALLLLAGRRPRTRRESRDE
ncbi:flippase-like domain-containing protein [Microbacterium sp. NEAU-LLC]|uniref:Flippase-like domain-containing protein n=1 Tax=Microbacterium helvum TaxID=2773713 RepID=A0ABR8NHV3_9MICO|nr:lysylphosphatidylglycerol synthase transmembrane domain-containing protein [Microbacterium helvum]MBD3940284.1 flippase-like domain-containing protein [Microbacterium helvum]